MYKSTKYMESTWKPDENHHTVNTSIETIEQSIMTSKINLPSKKTTLLISNLIIQEKEALNELANTDGLVISKPDKGRVMVIQDSDGYI